MYVAGLEKTIQEAHKVAREKVCAAQKSIKRDYDIHMRTKKYKVGDLVYWRRNVGKKRPIRLVRPWNSHTN